MKKFYSLAEVADMLSVSKETLRRWDKNGSLTPIRHPINNYRVYPSASLMKFEQLGFLFEDRPASTPKPLYDYTIIELFSGAGGLALGLDKAGFNCTLLNDIDRSACATLKQNRPDWNVVHGDIAAINFLPYKGKVDVQQAAFLAKLLVMQGKNWASKMQEEPYFMSLPAP